jgi:hypothetical protein
MGFQGEKEDCNMCCYHSVNFLEVEKEEIHKGNLNQPLLKLGSSPSSFREGSLYII